MSGWRELKSNVCVNNNQSYVNSKDGKAHWVASGNYLRYNQKYEDDISDVNLQINVWMFGEK